MLPRIPYHRRHDLESGLTVAFPFSIWFLGVSNVVSLTGVPSFYFPLATILIIALLIALGYTQHRYIRRAKAADWSQCMTCGYDLRELPDTGPCPECGHAYDLDETRRFWRTKYNARLREPARPPARRALTPPRPHPTAPSPHRAQHRRVQRHPHRRDHHQRRRRPLPPRHLRVDRHRAPRHTHHRP